MGRRTREWHMAQASKAEALIAVEFYNTTGERRSLEGFVVHMHLAWLYLLQAEFTRDDIDFRHWAKDDKGRLRIVRIDGEPKTWELATCVKQRWPAANEPIRRNLEFFIGLRNKIEHRYQDAIGAAVAGHAQAMILNYETELVGAFGADEGLADRLRFPVFVTSLIPSGVDAIRRLRANLPARATRYINDFHEYLDQGVAADPRFEFRVHLVPQLGPRASSDLAVNFVRLDELDADMRRALERLGNTGLVATKVKREPVQHLNWHRPGAVVGLVAKSVPGFSMNDHTEAWRRHGVRPDGHAADPAATDARYCLYDAAHGDFVYSDAWARKLIAELGPPRYSTGSSAIPGPPDRAHDGALRGS